MLLEALIKQSGLGENQLQHFANTASKRYKTYSIPKRGGGLRTIHHPSRNLKIIQRWISKALIRQFPIDESASAYKVGASIRQNAEAHLNTAFTLHMDFENFFPSFTEQNVRDFLRSQDKTLEIGLNETDINFVGSIVTRYGALTIGAPSSPILTNSMMFEFDRRMNEITHSKAFKYTRYADDLYISSTEPNTLHQAHDKVQELVADFDVVRLRINSEKTKFLSKKYRRSVTGLVLTPENKISLGRSRKRKIKSLVYLFKNGRLDMEKKSELQGLVAFAKDAELSFFHTLVRKYGDDTLNNILKKVG